MSGFDDPGVYYSDSFGGGEGIGDEGVVKRSQIKKKFREFLRQFRVGTDRTGFTYKYRYCDITGVFFLAPLWLFFQSDKIRLHN